MRWRDVKQNKIPPKQEITPQIKLSAPIPWRIKAFLTDLFMIYVPIIYVTTYVILGSKEALKQNQFALFAVSALFGIIMSIFWAKTGQSPGYKAYEMRVIDTKTEKNPTFLKGILRYICFIISASSIFGILLCFFRKDKKNLHDILSNTMCVKIENV